MNILFLLMPCALIALGAETSYYLVEGIMKLPDGKQVGASVSIVKRSVDRDAGRIEETVLSLRGQEPAKEFITWITPSTTKAAVTSPQGGVIGQATLSGPDWAWTKMVFTTTMQGLAIRVEGEDEFLPDSIKARKKIFNGEGKMQIQIEESGKSISSEVYKILRTRLLAQ